jgi:hypothetical protein
VGVVMGQRTLLSAALVVLVGLVTATLAPAQAGDSAGTWPALEGLPPTEVDTGSQDAALIVAVENYSRLDPVEGASRNGIAWSKWLTGRGTNVRMLQGAAASKGAITKALNAAIGDVKEGGTLWVIYIAHGLPGEVEDGKSRDGLLATYDTNGVDEEEARDTSVSRNWLFRQIDAASNVRRAVVLLDTCFSGVGSGGKSFSGRAFSPVPVPAAVQPKRVVLTAGGHNEYALPLPCHKERRPAFSYLALGALRGWADGARDNRRDGSVTAEELVAYVSETLQRVDPRGRQQTPELVATAERQNLAQGREAAPDLNRLQCHDAAARPTPSPLPTPVPPVRPVEITPVELPRQPPPPPPYEEDEMNPAAEAAQAKAERLEADANATPEAKRAAWAALEQVGDPNPYRAAAKTAKERYDQYLQELAQRLVVMRSRFATLEQLLQIPEWTVQQKIAQCDRFFNRLWDGSGGGGNESTALAGGPGKWPWGCA